MRVASLMSPWLVLDIGSRPSANGGKCQSSEPSSGLAD